MIQMYTNREMSAITYRESLRHRDVCVTQIATDKSYERVQGGARSPVARVSNVPCRDSR